MAAFYVFALVLGGGFLGLSLLGDLFGGHSDLDLNADAGGLDADLDLDVGHLDVDAGHLELDAGHMDVDASHAGIDDVGGAHAAAKIFSIRTIIYSLFGFGAVGTLRTFLFPSSSSLLTLILAVATGLLSGALINAAFAWVRRSESGVVEGESSYAGLTGRVKLPIEGSSGTVVVERGGRWVELRALPHPSALDQGDPKGWTSVFVVEMRKGVALVAPTERDMLP
jgi:hypothetical protein